MTSVVTPQHWEDIVDGDDDDPNADQQQQHEHDSNRDPSQSHLECCAICLDPRAEPNQMALLLPCQHRCDADCIEQWRSRQVGTPQTPCPLCRAPIERVVVGAEIELILQLGAKNSVGENDDAEVGNRRNMNGNSRFQRSRERNRNAGRRWGPPSPRRGERSRPRYFDEDDDVYFSTQDELSQWCAVEDAMVERAILANERRRREKNWMERD